MVIKNEYNPGKELLLDLIVSSFAVQTFIKEMAAAKNGRKRLLAKSKMKNKGFSLDEMCEIVPFRRRN